MSRLWRPSRSLDTGTSSHDRVGLGAHALAAAASPPRGPR